MYVDYLWLNHELPQILSSSFCDEISQDVDFTLMLLVAYFAIQNDAKTWKKWLKPWHIGTRLGVLIESYPMNTMVQSTRMQIFLETIWTLSCWYSLNSSCRVLSDEYPFDRVSGFLDHCVLAKVATSSIRVSTSAESLYRSHVVDAEWWLFLMRVGICLFHRQACT